jgi:hypothetical protein
LLLLLLTDVEQEPGALLAVLLGHAAKLSLLHPKSCTGLAGLNTKLTVLRSEAANALSDLSRLLGALKSQATCRFGARHPHLGLSLTELTVLLSHLSGILLCGHAKLSCALGNVGLGGCPRHTHLTRLLSKLTGELGRVHAGVGCELLDVHASLSLSPGIGGSQLLSRKPRLGCKLSAGKAKLTRLKRPGLRKLLCREAKLTGGLCGLLPLGCKRLRVSRSLVAGGEAKLARLNASALRQLLSTHA